MLAWLEKTFKDSQLELEKNARLNSARRLVFHRASFSQSAWDLLEKAMENGESTICALNLERLLPAMKGLRWII